MILRCKDQLIDLKIPKIAGILNLTTDSFYDGGKYNSSSRALKQAEQMLNEGADFIDVGASSSKPGAAVSGADEEKTRLFPILEALLKAFPEAYFSVDTYHSCVAEGSLQRGVALINDISGGQMDQK
ncbi:MAG: dihydropteroate synthase, partial [Flavobacteriia bacterium]|nr:dihydropteroate synthase [Flavobacteriia bacterium]